jgi:polyhydroxybutyrate depolymerase
MGIKNMKQFFRLLSYPGLIGISWFILASCAGPPPEIPPGPREVQIGHDNYIRNVTFHIPKKLRKRNRSLVLCLHDGGESPESMARMTRRNFNKLAEKNNFIVGYPEALNEYWNDAREDSVSLSHYDEIDDVGFIEKVMDYAIDSFKIDIDKIYIAGFSEGGLMAFRLACEIPQKIHGFAMVAATMPLDQIVECTPDTTASFIMINGTRDPVLPYEGGQLIIEDQEMGSMLAAEEAMNYWLEENECTDRSSNKEMANRDTFDETRSERVLYDDCKNKNKLMLIRVVNGGHSWPGGRQYQNEKSVGKVAQDFDAADVIWKFFKTL